MFWIAGGVLHYAGPLALWLRMTNQAGRLCARQSFLMGQSQHMKSDVYRANAKRLIVIVTSITLAVWSHAQNLIVNGSFETPVYPFSAAYYPSTNDLAPWQTDGANFEILASSLTNEWAAEGRQHLEILGGGTSVWQTVTTIIGENYQLRFSHSPRPTVHSTMTVSINGKDIANFDEDGTALSAYNWHTYRTNFTADATNTTITFSDAAPTAAGTHIDNIIFQRLPQNSSIRFSEVEISWETVIGKTYQLQFKSSLASNTWTDLGSSFSGTGTTFYIREAIPEGEPQKYYRVITLP